MPRLAPPIGEKKDVSYAAIIDAGSSSSKFFIYRWESPTIDGQEIPLAIRTAFPLTAAEKNAAVARGGIQRQQDHMQQYLSPLLSAGRTFLKSQNVTEKVPLYILATGGMRDTDAPTQEAVKSAAYSVMKQFHESFLVGVSEDDHVRVIPGRVEGLYGWVALNYGKGAEEQISGLLELGGASMQIAFKVPNAYLAMEKICLLSGEHRVYSQTWDGFGADSITKKALDSVVKYAGRGGTGAILNACLPRGQVGGIVDGTNRTIAGSGDFANCLSLMQQILVQGLKTHEAIPPYLDIASYSQHLYAVSSFWYSYQFFAKWGGYNVRRAYDRQLFTAAVTKYCTSAWDEIQWKVDDPDRETFINNRCAHAAWMLTLLHDDQYGFGLEMTEYDTWRGLLRFPTTNSLASRASWTVGAAALIARHGELAFCSKEQSNIGPAMHDSTNASYYSVAHVQVDYCQSMQPGQGTLSTMPSRYAVIDLLNYIAVVFIFVYQAGRLFRGHYRGNQIQKSGGVLIA